MVFYHGRSVYLHPQNDNLEQATQARILLEKENIFISESVCAEFSFIMDKIYQNLSL